MAVFTSGVPSDASNVPCEKKHAGTTSQLFQKKRLCVIPYIADIEQQQQLKQQQHGGGWTAALRFRIWIAA